MHFFKEITRISNLITLSRIALTPFVVYAILYKWWYAAFILLFVAALTDVADGYYARFSGYTSRFGALFDPLADKILIVSSFTALAFSGIPTLVIPGWFVWLLLAREALLIAGSAVLLLVVPRVQLQANYWGKTTTFLQLVLIFWLFLCYQFAWFPYKTYHFVLFLLVIITLISCFPYIFVGLKYFKSGLKYKNTQK